MKQQSNKQSHSHIVTLLSQVYWNVLLVISIVCVWVGWVDLAVFWQPGSISNVLICHRLLLFLSQTYIFFCCCCCCFFFCCTSASYPSAPSSSVSFFNSSSLTEILQTFYPLSVLFLITNVDQLFMTLGEILFRCFVNSTPASLKSLADDVTIQFTWLRNIHGYIHSAA